MKRRLVLACVIMLFLCFFAGCECKHTWVEATCEDPKTCSECGLTEGSAKGHTWIGATCETPKTCSECSLVEGSSKGHEWTSATCQAPKTCSICGEEIGEKANHSYIKKITTSKYLCSEATLSSPAKYYYACKHCEQKGTTTYTHGESRPSIWVRGYYVDKFGDKTDAWYVKLRNKVDGTFSNTATTNSALWADITYDQSRNSDNDGLDDISIFLYEYANEDNLVKNGSSRYSEYYKITIKNGDGKTIEVRGKIYAGSDRIHIIEEDVSAVLDMMKTSTTMRFHIQNEDRPATIYRFDLDLTDFVYVMNQMINGAP